MCAALAHDDVATDAAEHNGFEQNRHETLATRREYAALASLSIGDYPPNGPRSPSIASLPVLACCP